MAKPKPARKKKPQTSKVLSRLQSNMKRLQRDAEILMKRTQQQATHLISRDQRRALDRLFKQAQRLRTDLEKRARRASKDVESRAERLLSTLEKEASKRVSPVLKRLDLPTRSDVQKLSRRISRLEQRLASGRSARPATETSPAPSDVSADSMTK